MIRERDEVLEKEDIRKARAPPNKVTKNAESLNQRGRVGWVKGETKVQLKNEPLLIAPKERRMVGKEISIIPSWVDCVGEDREDLKITVIIRRMEYAAVRAVEKNKRERIMKFVGDHKENSRIMSFE